MRSRPEAESILTGFPPKVFSRSLGTLEREEADDGIRTHDLLHGKQTL
jgi:hypothetical protein